MPELDVDWKAIEVSAIAGVPYPAIAAQWGMFDERGRPDTNAIRQRAFREKWPVPAAVRKRSQNQHSKAIAAQEEARGKLREKGITEYNAIPVTRVTEAQKGGFLKTQTNENAAVIITDNLLDLAKAGSLRFAQVAHRSLQAMPEELLIVSPSDAATTVKTLRSIAGMDKEGASVVVQLNGWSEWPEPEPVTRDVTDSVTAPQVVNWDDY